MSQFKRNKADDRTRTDNLLITNQLLCQLSHIGMANDSYGNRTRVTAVKGRCLDRLTKEPYFTEYDFNISLFYLQALFNAWRKKISKDWFTDLSSPSWVRTNDPSVNSRMLCR